MKKILFAMILACCTMSASAQDRSAYTFKTSFHLDENLVDSVTVEAYLNGVKTDLNFSQRLFTPRELNDGYTTWISEPDINFDGIPDLMVYYGYVGYGGQGGDVYSAYVWNAEESKFVFEEEFQMLPDPDFEPDIQRVHVSYRLSETTFVRAVYKWEGYKLIKVTFDEEDIDYSSGDTYNDDLRSLVEGDD